MSGFDRVLLCKPELFVYRVGPRTTNRAVKASDWGLSNPQFTGRLRVMETDGKLFLNIEDSNSGKLFARSYIDNWPTPSFESVSDSSRYFLVKLHSDDGRHAYVGIGFADRSDSFDLNVMLQDHFKRDEIDKKQKMLNSGDIKDDSPKMDLSLKKGQKLTINLNTTTKTEQNSAKSRTSQNSSINFKVDAFLPPPPNNKKIQNKNDDFGDFGSSTNDWVKF